jgi:hypothetical protein
MNLNNISDFSGVALSLSDGTPVEFSKITSKGNVQVRVPTSHPELGDDPLRIFRLDGTHYKDETDLTLVANANANTQVFQGRGVTVTVTFN